MIIARVRSRIVLSLSPGAAVAFNPDGELI
jgi:hypothetical protein